MNRLVIHVLGILFLIHLKVNSENTTTSDSLIASSLSENEEIANDNATVLTRIDAEPAFNETQFVLNISKCCTTEEVLDLGQKGCIKKQVDFVLKFDILEHNETHVNNESLDITKFSYAFNHSPIQCKRKFFVNETTDFRFLTNGSVITRHKIYPRWDFCVDMLFNNDTPKEKSAVIIFCAPEGSRILYDIYIGFLSTSIFCLMCGAILFRFKFEATENLHRLCILLYFLSMDINCVVQLIILVGSVNCELIGIFFQVTYIFSNIWLLILCADVVYITYYFHHDTKWDKRIYYYVGISLIVPLFSIFSLLTEGGTATPNTFFKYEYNRENMCYIQGDARKVFFYLPVSLSMFGSILCLCYTYYNYCRKKKPPNADDVSWVKKKIMWKQSLIAFVISFVIFLVHCGSQFLMNTSNGFGMFFEMCDALHGTIVFFIFIIYKHRILLGYFKNFRRGTRSKPGREELPLNG